MSKKIHLIVLLSLGLILGCAKERAQEFRQGSGKNLQAISEYQNKTFVIESESQAESSKSIASGAENIEIDSKFNSVNNMKILKFKGEIHPLLSKVNLRGVPGKSYELRMEVTKTHLMIYKIGNAREIPTQEMTYATKIEGDRFKVPLGGYDIKLIRVESETNENKESTHNLKEISVSSLGEATHFKADLSDASIYNDFKPVDKKDVFASNLFEGEWFYASTIVGASTEKAMSIGRDLSADFKARSVSRIKFIRQKDRLRAVNLNISKDTDKSDAINFKSAIEIPVDWVDYKIEDSGSNAHMKEIELGDSEDESKEWRERPFMKVKFDEVVSLVSKDQTDGKFYSLELSDDYISFVIYHPAQEIRVKYAFRKAHSPIEGRVYKIDDRRKFGFFTTEKEFIKGSYKFYKEEDYEKQTLLNRFYPRDGKIIYHFSKVTPNHLLDTGRRAVKAWNKAFQEAGTGIEVLLDESKRVSLGDIRYNIINIVDTKDGARLLGYGPSIVDSQSGEIISATSNIYANPFRNGIIRTLRNYVRARRGFFKKSYVGVSSVSQASDDSMVKQFLKEIEESGKEIKLKEEGNEAFSSTHQKLSKVLDVFKRKDSNDFSRFVDNGSHCSFEVSYKDTIKKIESVCKEDMEKYLSQIDQASDKESIDEIINIYEVGVLEACSEKLIEDRVLATLIHEMGHNLGLRHNFLASSDPENFIINKESGKPVAMSASTMDYATNDVNELLTPGKYDVAAIRFGYSGSVEMENGAIEKLDPELSIVEQTTQKGSPIRKFKYCSDEHTDMGAYNRQTDPLCNRHDYGTNPSELVDHLIHSFQARYATYAHRHDRASSPHEMVLGVNNLERTFLPMKKIHDQWRYEFAKFVGKNNQYLEKFDAATMAKKLVEMEKDPGEAGKMYKRYYPAVKKSYEFIKELVFLPVRTCIYSNKNTKKEEEPEHNIALPFEKLRQDLFGEKAIVLNDCNDPTLQSQLSNEESRKSLLKNQDSLALFSQYEMELIDTKGSFLLNRRKSLDASSREYEIIDVAGIEMTRLFAHVTFTARDTRLYHLRREDFKPSFLDDPIFREEYQSLLLNRVFNGQKGSDLMMKEKYLPIFYQEKNMLKSLMITYVKGLQVPGKRNLNHERQKPFTSTMTGDPRVINQEGVEYTEFLNRYIFATPENPIGQQMIKLRKRLKSLQENSEKDQLIFSEENIKGLLAQIPRFNDEYLNTKKTADFISDLVKIEENLGSIEPKEAKDDIEKLLAIEFSLLQIFKDNKDKITDEDKAMNLREFLAKRLNLVKEEQLLFHAKFHEQRVKKFMQAQASKLGLLKLYQNNTDDYNAQLDLLTELLLAI